MKWKGLLSAGAGESGSTLVEFAVAAPLLLFFLLSIVDFGRAFYDYDLVANDARLGTRYAMVRGSTCTYVGCPASQSSIQDYVRSVTTGIDPNAVTVTAKYVTNPDDSRCSATAYPTGTTAEGPACIVKVTVSYPFSFAVVPFAGTTITSSAQLIITQ